MEIHIHIFNVLHGDSIVIEFIEDNYSQYIVIDSHILKVGNQTIHPVSLFLKKRKAKKIALLVVTHLHIDHIRGIEEILNTENFEILSMLIPPVFSMNSKVHEEIINKYKEKIKEVLTLSDNNMEVRSPMKSLISLLSFITKNRDIVREAKGLEDILRIKEIPKVNAKIYMPLSKIKGIIHGFILKKNFDLNHFPEMNDSSIVLEFDFLGNKFIFAGDTTENQILEHKRMMNRSGVYDLNADLLKIPHHGSRENNNLETFEYWFGKKLKGKKVFISANGRTHPHEEVLKLINKHNIYPWCTCLSKHCINKEPIDFEKFKTFPKEFRPFLIHYQSESNPIQCQGDIHIKIGSYGIKVSNSTNNPCIYHN